VNRNAQGVVLLLVGGAVMRAGLTDMYLRYVKAGLRPVLLAAGVILIAAALATFWYEWRTVRDDHGHREPWVAWLLVLPLFALIVVAPPALGSYAADRTGTALQRPPGFAALPAGDPLRITVLDYAGRAVYDHGQSLGGRRFELTGFITVGPHGAPYLTRMILSCCAADAQPIKVGLTGAVPAGLQPDTWLDVVGTYTDRLAHDEVNNGPIPYLDISQATRVPPPPDQYES
jgi:putative membrane protein